MGVLDDFFNRINNQERKKAKFFYKHLKSDKEKQKTDIDYLFKVLLTWYVGGIISLMPTISNIYIQSKDISSFMTALFSNKDLFLVITTLIVSALLELIFSDNNGISKYFVVASGIIMTVFSMHVCSLIQSQTQVPYIERIGEALFVLCVIISSFGYIICSRKREVKQFG